MKTRTTAAILACTLAACSDDAGNPVAPSAPGASPEAAAPAPGLAGDHANHATSGASPPFDSRTSGADGPPPPPDPELDALRNEVDRILGSARVLEPAPAGVRYDPAPPLLAPLHQVPAWFDWRHYAESVHSCLDGGGRCAPRSRVLNRPERQDVVVFARDLAGVCRNVGTSHIVDASYRSIPWIRLMSEELPRVHNQFTGTRYSGRQFTTTNPTSAAYWLRARGSTVVLPYRERRRFGTRTIAYAGWGYEAGLLVFLLDRNCRLNISGEAAFRTTFAHEIGHTLGFAHVGTRNSLMYPTLSDPPLAGVNYNEFMHARLAFSARRGRPIGRGWWPLSAPGSSGLEPSRDASAPALDTPVIFVN